MSLDIGVEDGGIVVTDEIEQRRCVFRSPDPPALARVSGERFYFPVDEAVELDAHSVTLPNVVSTFVRTAEGDLLDGVEAGEEQTYEDGSYSVELDDSIKLYLRVDGPLTVSRTDLTTTVESEGTIALGARSRHTNPAGTITTTSDPADLMAALTAFGSALKTTSPERSYPTLRGHPPELELGSSLSIPEGLEPPDTGLTIELPPDRRYVYPAASLAFYLGARIEPGPYPRIVGEDGFTYDLADELDYQRRVERTLKQVFLLDCVVRNEGFYDVDLASKRAVNDRLDLDTAALYDASPTERLRAYLDVPWQEVEDLVPTWTVTTHLAPTPENAELLPFLVQDLAVIRLPAGQSVSTAEAQRASIDQFTRGSGAAPASFPDDGFSRSISRSRTNGESAPSLVQPEGSDSIGQIWADENAPVGAAKASVQAFRNGLAHEPSEEIGVTVVVNDEEMAEEGTVAESVYGDDTTFPLDVRIYEDVTTEALRAILETDRDFLHYIGHIEPDGFECADGRLDVRELDAVGMDAFFLNACASYDQGMALLERGAVGGVVTISDVLNSGATRVGKSMVELLNYGFPLRAALDVASRRSLVGGQYIVVGDGRVDIVQPDDLVVTLYHLEEADSGNGFNVQPEIFATAAAGLGTFTSLDFAPTTESYLIPGKIDTLELSEEETSEFLSTYAEPVWWAGDLYWGSDLPTDHQ